MLERAVIFAANAHRGQRRKGTNLPYIVHPMEVAAIAAGITDDIEVICAAMLHDVIEDCDGVTYTQLEQEFGSRVASLVAMESEDKSKTWQERKQHTIDFLTYEASREMKIIALSDKLANIRSLKRDYLKIGDELWQRFNEKDKRKQGWYYCSMIPSLSSLSYSSEYHEYVRLVQDVFQDIMK
ncbi:MAG: HD domain-containing protein [Anaerostipes sp.]|uniref:HD domain-containing protein n=1 Tax=Anaerostipes sp. 992a TaxID=1261637 RepID=UPI000952FFB9|nr:HD domain-containing protein [Anaerostipes sp. 992a]MCI5952448.1 HD domain-containing protein [Anaerostipes sp.]MDD5968202.1 HD domain-containing protein [Anaerostipes sp.]OLR62138.1 phosphohydrolase [Anaerostipes sp. 992a]